MEVGAGGARMELEIGDLDREAGGARGRHRVHGRHVAVVGEVLPADVEAQDEPRQPAGARGPRGSIAALSATAAPDWTAYGIHWPARSTPRSGWRQRRKVSAAVDAAGVEAYDGLVVQLELQLAGSHGRPPRVPRARAGPPPGRSGPPARDRCRSSLLRQPRCGHLSTVRVTAV